MAMVTAMLVNVCVMHDMVVRRALPNFVLIIVVETQELVPMVFAFAVKVGVVNIV
tara:strand:+ start:723 stop:887 length:165 start_codon:yes stop_codon:yes gene_type:complete